MILHLNSYYFTNNIYANLYKELDKLNEILVYVPIKWNVDCENHQFYDYSKTRFVISKIVKRRHRFFYFSKIELLYRDLKAKVDLKNVTHVHAHNLFIDGALAYMLYQEYNIPFSISVRMTDVSMQYRFMIHRRTFAHKILEKAIAVVSISSVYQNRLLTMLPVQIARNLESKFSVIPNGINADWFVDSPAKETRFMPENSFRLLYIGQIIRRKKVLNVVSAVERLLLEGHKIELTIVGGENIDEKDYYQKFKKVIAKKTFVTYLGKVNDISLIKKTMSENHAFIMTPVNELFGVVYIEALSQGLPVIYSISEGISSYLEGEDFGLAVDPRSLTSIQQGILEIRERGHHYEKIKEFASQFNWSSIAGKYMKIFNLSK